MGAPQGAEKYEFFDFGGYSSLSCGYKFMGLGERIWGSLSDFRAFPEKKLVFARKYVER